MRHCYLRNGAESAVKESRELFYGKNKSSALLLVLLSCCDYASIFPLIPPDACHCNMGFRKFTCFFISLIYSSFGAIGKNPIGSQSFIICVILSTISPFSTILLTNSRVIPRCCIRSAACSAYCVQSTLILGFSTYVPRWD